MLDQKLTSIAASFKDELSGIRTNRPTPKLVENIKVEAYGQHMTVKQVGAISIMPPREIDISVWDKDVVNVVAKAIEGSGLGVTANVDGTLIRINLPILTDERRKELEKLIRSMAEEARIKIRHARDEANKDIERDFKDKKISEDKKFKGKEKVQKAVDEANKKIEDALESKLKEISE